MELQVNTALIKSIANELLKTEKYNLFIYSESPNILKKKNPLVKLRKLNNQNVNSTVGGCLKYKDKNILINQLKKDKIEAVIISTFFDKDLMLELKNSGIKTILINYPLRDTHKYAFLLKKYYKCFTSIYSLKGISKTKKLFPNEYILSPIKPKKTHSNNYKKNSKKINILVTCGGGGLNSSKIFFEIINYIINELSEKEVTFNIITGNSNFNFINKKNIKITKWADNFIELLNDSDLIISEAGYFTLLDLILVKKPAIMIPGKRGIDNQELRAVKFDLRGAGMMHFPFQEKNNLKKIILKILKNPKEYDKLNNSKNKIAKEIFNGKNIIDKLLEELK